MSEPLILDTNALDNRDFMYWLRNYRGQVILPVIAYCEFCYYKCVLQGKSNRQVDALLRTASIEVRDMSKREAICVAENCRNIDEPDFKENWRDYMIGAFAHLPPHILVTDNIQDFTFLGRRVIKPITLMNKTGIKGKRKKRSRRRGRK